MRGESESCSVVALRVTTGVPYHLHGNAAACGRISVDGARNFVGVHRVYHVPNAVQSKVPPLVDGSSHPLVLRRKGAETDVLVPLVVYCLSHFLGGFTALVLVWPLYFSVNGFHVSCPCPAPPSGRFPLHFLTVVLAEPDVERSRTLQQSRLTCRHLCSTTALRVAVSVLPSVDDGCALP